MTPYHATYEGHALLIMDLRRFCGRTLKTARKVVLKVTDYPEPGGKYEGVFIEIDARIDEADLARHEFPDLSTGPRTWFVPPELINGHSRFRIIDADEWADMQSRTFGTGEVVVGMGENGMPIMTGSGDRKPPPPSWIETVDFVPMLNAQRGS